MSLALWPTTLLSRTHPDAMALNADLLALMAECRKSKENQPEPPVWASTDDLLQRYPEHPALQSLFGFVSDVVFEAARVANSEVWAELGAPGLRIVMVGAWFQVQNQGGRHGIHNHGNCSWSGVYYVDVDPAPERVRHPQFGALNGITRFHGPHLARLGGAHMDLGSAYLQHSTHDVHPVPGTVIVFPSWLLHEVLPYEGQRDRVIVSFNAQLHPQTGTSGLQFGF